MDNPQAFPSEEKIIQTQSDRDGMIEDIHTTTNYHSGMELRDYLAGQSIQGLSRADWQDKNFIAKNAYELADAMLKERARHV